MSGAESSGAGVHDPAYLEVLNRLYRSRRGGMRFGLERVRACLKRLGDPHSRIDAVVQIGGTNGKGSTAAFCDSILSESGLRVGRFSSPHLSSLTERFSVCGRSVSYGAVVEAHAALTSAGGHELTFFEQVTVMAVLLFARLEVDVALLEVGLGGRLDSTTAIPASVAAVTGVAIDHADYLGSSLSQIAAEKGAIFRPSQPAVIGLSGEPEGVSFLLEQAHLRRAHPICQIEPEAVVAVAADLGLKGTFQRPNAACAVAIANALADLAGRPRPGTEAVELGLARARLPGRMEEIAREPSVIVDGAHNPHAARSLAGELGDDVVVLCAVCGDKDAAGIVGALGEKSRRFVVTEVRGERAMPCDRLAQIVAEEVPGAAVRSLTDSRAALDEARRQAAPGGVVVCCWLAVSGRRGAGALRAGGGGSGRSQ